MNFTDISAAFFSGIAGALGVGGGGVLVLYLTLSAKMHQIKAQGINLVFFIPCAIIAIIIHSKKRLIKWKKIIPIIIGGIPGVLSGMYIVNQISTELISKIFAGLLIFMGLKEFFSHSLNDNQDRIAK